MKALLKEMGISLLLMVVMLILCCGVYPLAVWAIGQAIFPNQANGSLVTKDGKFTTDDSQAVGSALLGQNFTAPQYFHPRPSAAGAGYDASASSGTNLGPLSDKLLNGATATAAPPATAPDSQAATAAATTTAPAETLAYDGIRLRVIHYALDNGISFNLYHVKFDATGEIIPASKIELTAAEKLKFIDAQGNVNDIALVDAFPHMDMSGKDAVIADDFSTLVPADAVTASASGLDPHISPDNAALQAQRIADNRKISRDKVIELIKQNTDNPNLGILGDAGVNVLMLNIALDKTAPMPVPASAATTQVGK